MKAYQDFEFTQGRERLADRRRSGDILKALRDAKTKLASGAAITESDVTGLVSDLEYIRAAISAKLDAGTLSNVTNDAQVKRAEMGAADGVATLDSGGNVPIDQMANVIIGGVTADRPAAPVLYQSYFDITIGKPCWWTGAAWVDATGATV